ncbi:MAG TPA: TonB-dependent siderophore receptor [Rhizomicrobium sp.]|nr:TonB-dependent siderophore receptor [Rhizomicrobium sp.]
MDSVKGRTAFGITSMGLTSMAAVTSAFGQTVVASNSGVETVNVTAQRTSIDMMPETVLNTPQSINIVPAQVIQEQGLNNLQDALRNVPGITLNAGEGGAHGDQVNLRGFSASDDFFLDGLRDTGFYTRDTFDMDSVEVYKGPASTLFGRGSTGGVINQITKKPQLYPIYDASLTGGTNSEIRATADVNYVISDDAALRLALMGETSGVEDRDFVHNRRWGAAPSFAYGIGRDTTVLVQYFHEQEDNTPDFGLPFVFGEPAPVKRDLYYGLPSDDRIKSDVNIGTARIDHAISNWLSISNKSRAGFYWFDTRQTAPTYGSANCYADATAPYTGAPLCTGAAGEVPVTTENPLYPVFGTPLNQIYVLRDRPSAEGTVQTLMNETDLTAKFETGPLAHTLVTGVEVDREAASLTRYVNQDDEIVPTPLLDPDPFEAFPGTQTSVRQQPITKTSTLGIFAVDTIDIGPHWNIVGALRFDHFGARFDQSVGTPSHFVHDDNIVSPRAAITYKPTENISAYISYGTSFDPSAENLSLAASNAGLDPEKDHTYEAGVKTLWLQGQLSATGAIFDTEMTNARIADPTQPGLQALEGDLDVKGFEFDLAGYITPQWEVDAGYTYLNPKADGLLGTGVESEIPNTAHDQANVWTTYDFQNGLKAGTGVYWTGRRFAGLDTLVDPGTTVQVQVPSSITWDAMVSYQITDNLGLQLNGQNLTNAYYYTNSYFTRPGENHVIPGAGRTFLLTANVSL